MTDHDGCAGCKYELESGERHPCSVCKQNYTDKWEPVGQSKRYKTKSCGIEAIQYDGLNHKEIEKFLGIPVAFDSGFAERRLIGFCLGVDGQIALIYPGNYVVKGHCGEPHIYESSTFENQYEPIEE